MTNRSKCRCSYHKFKHKWHNYPEEEVVLVVNPKCPIHGEIAKEHETD